MRSWYVSRRNESILNARVMAIFAAALVLILVWLLPREQTFRTMLATQQADRVSIAYARLLLGISPEDEELRQLLASQYYQLGEIEDAWDVIKDRSGDATLLDVNILQRITYAHKPGESRTEWQHRLLGALKTAASNDLIDTENLGELARVASSLDQPRLAAGLRERIYAASGKPVDLRRAAQAWVAANAPQHAVNLLLRDGLPADESLIKLAISSALATGDPSISMSIVESYLVANPIDDPDAKKPSTELVRYFIRATLASNKASAVPQLLAMLPPAETLSLSQATEFASAAVASGELGLAKTFIERALSIESNDAQLIRRLAQVYEWSGQPEDALQMWLRAADHSADQENLGRAWRLSKDLYHYQNAARLLGKLGETRRLTDEEVAVLRLAWEQHGDPDAGEVVLISYTGRWPEHRQGWQELIALQTNNLQLRSADAAWSRFNLHHSISVVENQAWADIKWRRYRPEEALDKLLQREPVGPNSAYWRQLAAYAWFLDKPGLASRAMETRLAEGEALNNFEMGQLIQGSSWSNPEMVAVHAASAWERQPENLDFLLTALYAALGAGNTATADELFNKALGNDDIRESLLKNAAFWTLRANHLQQEGDPKGAQLALHRALSLDPSNIELRANQLWMNIAQNELRSLRKNINSLLVVAEQHPVLWAPLASGYAQLQEHKQATPWFNRALQINTTDIGLLLAYSGSLEALGWRDPAYRLRRHSLKLLAAQSAKRQQRNNAVTADTVIAASNAIITGPQQRALLARLIAASPNAVFDANYGTTVIGQEDTDPLTREDIAESLAKNPESEEQIAERLAVIARFEFSDALRRAHFSSARYWLNVGAEASDGDRLVIATDEYNEDALAGLTLNDNFDISSQAAVALGQPGLAMNRTLEELQRNPHSRPALALRASLERELRPSGWQVSPVFEELGDFRFTGAEFLFSKRFERFHLDTRLRHQRATPQILQGPETFAESSIDSTLTYNNRWGTGVIGLGYTQGDERSLASINWQQEFAIDRRNSLLITLEHNARLQGGGVAQALLSRSGARVDWIKQLSARLQINTSLLANTYRDHNRDRVGDVTQFTISPNYTISRSGPTINLRGQAQWIVSSEQQLSLALQEFLSAPNQEVLPADTRSLSIGGVIARDRPGELDWRRPGTHYQLSADVGYRWPQQNLTFNSEAAIGVPIFGRDRLTASALFTNSLDNEVSETGVRAQLTYSRRLK